MAGATDLPVRLAPEALEGTALGEFIVVERLGEGGHGVVYRAEQPVLRREAAIKVLHERHRDRAETIERFLQEARLASRLDHPYAAHIYGFGAEADGLLWIAMEYVRGTPLDRWLARHGAMALDRFVPFLERLCEVVHTAHEQGIIHRDIKPANVMVLARAGRLLPKLLDFGVAKVIGEPTGDAPPEARRVGTPAYLAPELWLDAQHADARSDLYAVAALACEVLTGQPPFRGGSRRELAIAHARAPAPPLGPGFPDALDGVLARALAKRPAERFASLLDFAAAMRAASGVAGAEAQLPRLDDRLRDALIGSAPQPIAEAVSILDGARSAHQAIDALWQIAATALRYLALIGLAARTRTPRGPAPPAALDRLRALRRRTPSEDDWRDLLAALTAGDDPDAHPVPELVIAARATGAPASGAGAEAATEAATEAAIDPLLGLRSRIQYAAGASETAARALLGEAMPALEALLRRFEAVWSYPLVAWRGGAAELWMGLRRPRRPTLDQVAPLADGEVMLFGRDHRPVLRLSPLFAVASPTPGAPPELFLFDGQDRLGARFVAPPAGFEHHDDRVWDWLRGHVPELDGGGLARGDDERAPYRGLSAFSRDDAAVFFGREHETATFVNRLRSQPIAAVVGPSGAGKTSFVQAGVIPALPEGWRAITTRPGHAPLAALAARLRAAGIAGDDLAAQIAAGADALATALIADARAHGPLVLVIDQLEELFTLCHDPAERTRFAEAVTGAARTIDDPVRVVVTLRDDFLVRAEQVPALHDRISQSMQLLTVPAAADLVRILVEPAHRAGYELEDPALASDMVAEVAHLPGALALLSFTAAELWDQRDRHFKQLTRGVYRALGGVAGAFARHAEHTLSAMTAEQRRLTREAFRHLVTTQNTREVLARAELRQLLGDDDRADAVIEKLIAARLVVAADDDTGDTIEIVHEALLAAWPQLAAWRREDADGAQLRELLRTTARQWDERGRPSGMLWRGDALLDYTRWRARHGGRLTELEEAFGRASVEAAARGRRIRRGIVATAFVVFAAGIVVLLSINASKEAALRRAEDSDRISREQINALDQEHGRQLLLAGDPIRAAIYLDAARRAGGDGPALRHLLGRAIAILDKQQLALTGHAGAVRHGCYSPDGTLLVTAGDDHTARIWDARTGRALAVLTGHTMWVWVARFSPDGARVVTASLDGTARLWDAATGQLVAVLREGTQVSDAVFAGPEVWLRSSAPAVSRWDAATGAPRGRAAGHAARVTAIASDGRGRIASASADGAIQVHGPSGATVAALAVEPPATHLAFSRDGQRLALAGGTEVEVWDLGQRRRVATMHGHAAEVTAVEFAPDGARVASSSDDGTVRLWDAATGQALALIPSLAAIHWLAFSRDGSRIAVGGAGGASVWSTRNDGLRGVFDVGEPVSSIALRGDGGQVIACGALGAVRAWPTRPGGPAPLAMHAAARCAVAITPDGAIAITGDDDGKIRTWDTASGRPLREFAPSAAPRIYAITISPDGHRVITGHDDNAARIWDIATGRLLAELTGHDQAIFATAWSPDGRRVATCSNDGTPRIWNATTGAVIRSVTLDASCPGIAFDPGGGRIATASRHVAQTWAGAGEPDVFEGHQGDVSSVLFGPPGLLVTTSLDTTVRIWDLATRQPLESLAFPEPVDEADVSIDRSVLAVRSGDRVYLWELAPALSPARVRAIVDALPLALHDGALVRSRPPTGAATPADTARPSYRP